MVWSTKRDKAHVAVWQFIMAVHNEEIESLFNTPLYTHFENRVHLVPAMSIHQIQQLSGQSERVVSGTLETLTYEHVLWKINRMTAWTKDLEEVGLSFDEGNPHPDFEFLYVPVHLPTSPQIVNTWPKYTLGSGPFRDQIMEAAETHEEAREMWEQIVEMGLIDDFYGFRKIMNSVNVDGLSLREAVTQAADQ